MATCKACSPQTYMLWDFIASTVMRSTSRPKQEYRSTAGKCRFNKFSAKTREKEFSVSCKAMQSIFDSREKLPRSVIHRIACMKIFRLCRKISQTWNWNWSTFQKIAILFDNEPEKLRNRCLKIFIISADDVFLHLISRAAAMVVAGTGKVHVEHFELDVSYVFRKVGVVHQWREEGVKDLEVFLESFVSTSFQK